MGTTLTTVPTVQPANTDDYRCMFLDCTNFNSDISDGESPVTQAPVKLIPVGL